MLFLLINRTRPGLSAQQQALLAERAKTFYANVPEGVRVVGEWRATDWSANFAVLDAPDRSAMDRMQEPFRGLVDMEAIEIVATQGWTKS